ncbi:hypothetical protein ACS0TY_035274 [Phlomoides rotata]
MRKLLSGTDIVANPHINSKIRVWKKEYSALSDLLSKSGIGWNSTTNTIDVLDETVWDAQKKPYYESWLDIFGKDRATREHAADPIDIVNELMRNETEEEGEIGMKIDAEMKDNGQVAGDASVCKPSGSGLNTIKGKKRKGLPSEMALLVDTLGEFMKSTADSFNSLANRMVPELEVKVARTPLNDLMKCIPGGRAPNNEGKPTLEETVAAYIARSDQRMGKFEEQLRGLSGLPNQLKNLEFQIGQVASSSQTRDQGKFPSTTEVNPKEHCKAITLRSGTSYKEPSLPQEGKAEKKEEHEGKSEEFIIADAREAMEKEVRVPKWRKAREERMIKEEANVKLDDHGGVLRQGGKQFKKMLWKVIGKMTYRKGMGDRSTFHWRLIDEKAQRVSSSKVEKQFKKMLWKVIGKMTYRKGMGDRSTFHWWLIDEKAQRLKCNGKEDRYPWPFR